MKAKITISQEFVDAIALAVTERLRPILKGSATTPAEDDDLLGIEKLAVYLGGVSIDWIYQRTSKNEIPFVKLGRLLKFRRSDIDRWLSARSVPAVAPLSAPLPRQGTRDSQSDDGVITTQKTG